MHLEAAKHQLVHVLQWSVDSEDHAGILGLDPRGFERLVQQVEDGDPWWLAKQLRDPRYSLGSRVEAAGFMRGPQANRLLLELLGG